MKRLVWLLAVAFLCMPVSAWANDEPITSVADLVEEMRTRYDGDWFETMTFVQETIRYRPDGSTDTSIWYEALAPNKLRIDFAPFEDGNGVLYHGNRQYRFQDGEQVNSGPNNPTSLLMGGLIYLQPVETSVALLDSIGYDLEAFHETEWEGRPTYVIGAEAGDLETPQIWVDKEHLYYVRSLRRVGQNQERILDTQYKDFQRLSKGWTEMRVDFFLDGTLIQLEYYSNVRVVPLDDHLFNPEQWRVDVYWE